MNIVDLINKLKIIAKEHGEDSMVETFSNELTVIDVFGEEVADIELR